MSLFSQEFDRGGLGMNHFESWTQFVDVEKSEYSPFSNPDDSEQRDSAKSLIGVGSRMERCPTACLTLAPEGVKSVSFLRNLVAYPSEWICPSTYRSGRIAPVVHHRRPHNIPRLIQSRSIIEIDISAG